MIQVKNRACVRTVAVRSLWASKMRNLIAVIAIMLATMLFTALFTIRSSSPTFLWSEVMGTGLLRN